MPTRPLLAIGLLLTALAPGCGTPRPAEVPAPAGPATLPDTEEEVVALTRAVYARHGFDEAAGIVVAHDDTALIPYTDPRTGGVVGRRFLGPRAQFLAHLAEVDAALYGGRLRAQSEALGARDQASYQAFMIGVYAHELAHAVGLARGVSVWTTDPWREETRAIRFEVAVLREPVAAGHLPAGLLDDWRAFNEALLAAAPDGVAAALPADDAGRQAAFDAGYRWLSTGQLAGHAAEIDVVLALYTRYRLETLAAPPSWNALAAELRPPEETDGPAASERARRS